MHLDCFHCKFVNLQRRCLGSAACFVNKVKVQSTLGNLSQELSPAVKTCALKIGTSPKGYFHNSDER